MKGSLARFAAPVLAIALLAAWQAGCMALHLPSYLVPTPIAVAGAMVGDAPGLAASALATLQSALSALALAASVALPLALLTGVSRWAERAINPFAAVLQVTPVVAIAPLVVIWAGLEHSGRAVVILAALAAFFPIYSGAATGLKSADADLERLFTLYGAGRWARLVRLRAPAAAPHVLEGVKVAVGLAVIGSVVAEFVAGSGQTQGLAWRVLEDEHQLKTADMFAALVVLGALGAGLHAAADAGQRRLLRRWRGGG